MGRHKSVSRPSRPPEHLVSATFDEPYITTRLAVVRWWYGNLFQEQRTATPTPDFATRCKDQVQREDLAVMEQKVWGIAEAPAAYDFASLLAGQRK